MLYDSLMSGKHQVLIIEDEAILGESVKETLEEENYEVEWVKSGLEMWQKLETFVPQIILLDIMLPGGEDGFTLLKELKTLGSKFEKTPVVMMTNLSQASEMSRAMDNGAVDYMIKSNVDLDKVSEVVKMTLFKYVH